MAEKTMMDHLAERNPAGGGSTETQKKQEVDTAALLQQIADLGTKVDRVMQTNQALMTAPAPQAHSYQPQYQQPQQLPDLPDPLTDKEGYDAALEARIIGRLQNQQQAERNQQDAQRHHEQQVAGLWTEFGEKYPELAKHESYVSVAAQNVVKDAQKRGMDVNKYMFTARDQFLADVAAATTKEFGPVINPAAEPDAQRTAVFGGQESGGKPTATSGEAPRPSMSDDLVALQRKDGYY